MRTQQERCYHHPLRIGRLSAGGIATNTTQAKYLSQREAEGQRAREKENATNRTLSPLNFWSHLPLKE